MSYINSNQYLDIKWNKFIFNQLKNLKSKDVILWFFFYIPYYYTKEEYSELDTIRRVYKLMLEYCIENWDSNLIFTEEELIFFLRRNLYYLSYSLS